MTKEELTAQLAKFPDNTDVVIVDEDGWHLEIRELIYFLSHNEITIRPVKEKAWVKARETAA
jgi:hypothetical protein